MSTYSDTPRGSNIRVFLSYRREDTAGHAGRLYDALTARFTREAVFMDVDRIDPGSDFTEAVEDAIRSSDAVLVLIGPRWISASDDEGRPRLADPNDLVRREVEIALEAGTDVIPVLVSGAAVPRPGELPETLRLLLRRNAITLADERFHVDVTRLGDMLERSARDRGRRTAGRKERKVVSVLFVDLVASTAGSQSADPEDVSAVLDAYYPRVRKAIEAYGGTVDTFIGDAVVGVFGAPTAHEDDPERAVRAALAVQEAVDDLNAEQPELDLTARARVDTGEALVAFSARPEFGEAMVSGDVINTASRLQGITPAGGVVVGEATYRATRDFIEYEELPPVELKGKERPVRNWLATGARSRFGSEVDIRPATPFIGREDELELLRRTYARAVREPSVQLVTITGEPGVGKSRIVSEFFAFIESRDELVWWRQGRCLPYGEGITFWALSEIIKAHAGILDSDQQAEAERKLREAVDALVEDEADRHWIRARLSPLVGIPGEGTAPEREELFTAWQRFLEALAARGPLVLVIEDLHWAGPALLEFVEHLVEYTSGVPIILIATARPELYERMPTWGGGKRNASTVSLAPLSDEETTRVISGVLSQAVLPAEVQAKLLERAGGNPLYAEEFARMLIDRGAFERKGRGWVLREGAELEPPENINALIAARLDTLTPDRKALLQDASVVGKVFWPGAVAAVGGRTEREVEQALHELLRKELVRPARQSSLKDEKEYAFWHGLVREVAYGQIPRTARAEKHVAAARWIEGIAPDRAADFAEILAHHYLEARKLYEATGRTDDVVRLSHPARDALVAAGDRAARLDAAKAHRFFSQALELLGPGAERGSVLAKAAATAQTLERKESLYRNAVDELRTAGAITAAARSMVHLADIMWYRADSRNTVIRAEAVRLLEAEGPGPELAYAYTELANKAVVAGDSEAALRWAEQALRLAEELGVREVAVIALGERGTPRLNLGDLGGLEDMRQALRQAEDLGLTEVACRLHNNFAWELFPLEGVSSALHQFEEGVRFAQSRGDNWYTPQLQYGRVQMLLTAARWDEALSIADEILRAPAAGEMGTFFVHLARARVLVYRSRRNEAATILREIENASHEIEDPQFVGELLVTQALVNAGTDHERAVMDLERYLDVMVETADSLRSELLYEVVRVALALGARSIAERALSGMSERIPGIAVAVRSARAQLLEYDGDYEAAAAGHLEATAEWASYGRVVERMWSLVGLGRCLRRLGSPEADEQFRAARDIAAPLGAVLVLDEIDSWTGRSSAASS